MASVGHTSGGVVVGVIVSFTGLAGILVLSRLYARLIIVKNAGVDDVLVTFGQVSQIRECPPTFN
jgi:hypothetical protein